ncbi:hypothetical protein A2125_02110 [Candidatus Woesebacteria bacterium GWB1_43_5]|uniref:Uncharacterized protein n=1 Tax=Candidatus Woesebacteria bacterium GWB1_43_5 TaxID=1802474 RepID=A0A1F7WRH7_9BACT|nr:MAG: hypothetical protein A2125_02110 [Candidatus Woesebacteria bacterium GWB1_43_5]
MVKKFGLFILSFTLLLFYSPAYVDASILVVNKSGEIVWNVLSTSDQLALSIGEKNDIEIREIAGGTGSNQSILLKKENEKMVLNVGDEKQLDVTDWKNDLIEIEERGDVKKLTVLVKDGKFVINQGDIFAKTDFPVRIDPRENELSLITSSGSTALLVFPLEATQTSLRSKFISQITDRNLEIREKDSGILAYSVKGEKAINIFNVVNFNVPVIAFVSTTTGEILSVDQPAWLSILGFLFS